MELLEESTSEAGVFQKISIALQSWLDNLTVLEERNQIITSLQERIQRTLIQIQQEGTMTIYAFESLRYIGTLWSNLIGLLSVGMEDSNKRDIIKHLLQLYELEQITENMFIEIIIEL